MVIFLCYNCNKRKSEHAHITPCSPVLLDDATQNE